MHKQKWRAGVVLTLAATVGVTSGGLALAEEQAAPQVKRQHALNLLKRMSERLAHAKAFTFRARSTIESPGAGVMEFGTLAHSVTHSH